MRACSLEGIVRFACFGCQHSNMSTRMKRRCAKAPRPHTKETRQRGFNHLRAALPNRAYRRHCRRRRLLLRSAGGLLRCVVVLCRAVPPIILQLFLIIATVVAIVVAVGSCCGLVAVFCVAWWFCLGPSLLSSSNCPS